MTPTTNPTTPSFIRPRLPSVLFLSKKQSQKLPSAVWSFRWQNNTKRRTKNNNKHSGRFARNMVYMGCTLFGHGVWTWSSVFFDSVCARHPFPFETRPVRPAWVTGQLYSRLSLPPFCSVHSLSLSCSVSVAHRRLNGSFSPRFIGPPTPAGDWKRNSH